MTYSVWLGPFGWGIFTIGLILAIILFVVRKKIYPVMYLVSIATYIFTVGFVIDAFDLNRDMILLLFAITAGVFIFLGFRFSKRFSQEKEQFSSRIPQRR